MQQDQGKQHDAAQESEELLHSAQASLQAMQHDHEQQQAQMQVSSGLSSD